MGWLTKTTSRREPADEPQPGGREGASAGKAPPPGRRLPTAADAGAAARDSHEARGRAKYVELVDGAAEADAAWAELPEGARDLFVRLAFETEDGPLPPLRAWTRARAEAAASAAAAAAADDARAAADGALRNRAAAAAAASDAVDTPPRRRRPPPRRPPDGAGAAHALPWRVEPPPRYRPMPCAPRESLAATWSTSAIGAPWKPAGAGPVSPAAFILGSRHFATVPLTQPRKRPIARAPGGAPRPGRSRIAARRSGPSAPRSSTAKKPWAAARSTRARCSRRSGAGTASSPAPRRRAARRRRCPPRATARCRRGRGHRARRRRGSHRRATGPGTSLRLRPGRRTARGSPSRATSRPAAGACSGASA